MQQQPGQCVVVPAAYVALEAGTEQDSIFDHHSSVLQGRGHPGVAEISHYISADVPT